MNEFREKIRKEMWGLLALAGVMLVIIWALYYPMRDVVAAFERLDGESALSRIVPFVAGFATSFYAVAFLGIAVAAARRARMLRDERALNAYCVGRTDERNAAIDQKVGGATTVAMLIILAAGAYALFAFQQFVASLALIAALSALVFVRVFWRFYYARKM